MRTSSLEMGQKDTPLETVSTSPPCNRERLQFSLRMAANIAGRYGECGPWADARRKSGRLSRSR